MFNLAIWQRFLQLLDLLVADLGIFNVKPFKISQLHQWRKVRNLRIGNKKSLEVF